MTNVYLSEISRYDNRIDLLKEGIPDDILIHCTRYKDERDVQASLLGWNILLEILKKNGIDIKGLKLQYNDHNKPLLKQVYFNISHSLDVVAVAISSSEVGIDIQSIDERDYDLLANRYLSSSEKEEYDKSLNKADTFTRLWTIKESFYKHTGEGINLDTIKKELPYKDIFTTYLKDRDGRGYYLSVDCIDNQRVHITVL